MTLSTGCDRYMHDGGAGGCELGVDISTMEGVVYTRIYGRVMYMVGRGDRERSDGRRETAGTGTCHRPSLSEPNFLSWSSL
jgi:hypothetical protein